MMGCFQSKQKNQHLKHEIEYARKHTVFILKNSVFCPEKGSMQCWCCNHQVTVDQAFYIDINGWNRWAMCKMCHKLNYVGPKHVVPICVEFCMDPEGNI